MMDSFFGIGTAASRMTMKAAERPEHKEDSSRPRRQALHHQHYTRRTLGMGFLRQAVLLPPGQEREEWLAIHVLDFHETLAVLVRIVQDDENRPRLDPGWGFPPGYEYLWVDPATRKPIKCSGPDYIDSVLNWVEGIIHDERHFPTMPCSMNRSYPREFEKTVKTVFKRFFRIFAILYTHHYHAIEEMGAVAHLNTAFRHFLFFSFEWDLVPPQELEAIDMLVARMRHEYYQQGGHTPAAAVGAAAAAPEASSSLNPPSSPSSPVTPSSVVVQGR